MTMKCLHQGNFSVNIFGFVWLICEFFESSPLCGYLICTPIVFLWPVHKTEFNSVESGLALIVKSPFLLFNFSYQIIKRLFIRSSRVVRRDWRYSNALRRLMMALCGVTVVVYALVCAVNTLLIFVISPTCLPKQVSVYVWVGVRVDHSRPFGSSPVRTLVA